MLNCWVIKLFQLQQNESGDYDATYLSSDVCTIENQEDIDIDVSSLFNTSNVSQESCINTVNTTLIEQSNSSINLEMSAMVTFGKIKLKYMYIVIQPTILIK